jgi:hypothetical protein
MLLITLVTLLVYFILKLLLSFSPKAKKALDKKLDSYKYGVFIELFQASFLIVFLCAALNLEVANSENWVEGV